MRRCDDGERERGARILGALFGRPILPVEEGFSTEHEKVNTKLGEMMIYFHTAVINNIRMLKLGSDK